MSMSCCVTNCDSRTYLHKLWRLARQKSFNIAISDFENLNFISVSEFSQQILESSLPSHSNLKHIPNPVEVTFQEEKPIARPSESNNFTFIGRLSPEKGALLLAQIKSIPQEFLNFVGTGEIENELKRALPKAKFHGWCNKDEIVAILNDTRAVLFTSEWYETQGLVVAEAAAQGIPSIVSDCTAATEFIEHGVTGLCFTSGSVESLNEAIDILAKDDEFVDLLGENAFRHFWKTPPLLSLHAEALVSYYREILGQG